jgi:hypothetical protein
MKRKVLFMATLVLSLAAAGLSAGQLRAGASSFPACIVGRPCTATTICGRLCFCLMAEGQTNGACEPNTIPQARKVSGPASH